ncbi:MAG: transposase [Actinomycetia bacterium]|nr:transposase [Actinomycetes bacterium]
MSRRTRATTAPRSLAAPPVGVSQRIRKRVEEPFGWIKTVGAGRKVRYIGQDRTRAWFKTEAAVYNLIRICALDAAT